MEPNPSSSLEIPSFLFGTDTSVQREALKEGHRCAEQYRKDGSVPAPTEWRKVTPGEVVIASGGVDFQRERPAWRLYRLQDVIDGLCESLDWQDAFHVSDVYEAFCRETAWGALDFAISHNAPMSAERVSLRYQAVLRFWNSLQATRYLFSSPSALLTLDELMEVSCGWAMQAWCPEGGESVRTRLRTSAERMAHATKADSIEAIVRQLPYILPFARGLTHPDLLADPSLWRERLTALEPESFERVSAALPANLLERLYLWDKQLGVQ